MSSLTNPLSDSTYCFVNLSSLPLKKQPISSENLTDFVELANTTSFPTLYISIAPSSNIPLLYIFLILEFVGTSMESWNTAYNINCSDLGRSDSTKGSPFISNDQWSNK